MNWRIIIIQRFSHRSETSEPHIRLPSPGVLHREDKPIECLALKTSGAYFGESQRTVGNRDSTHVGNRDSTHKRAHTKSHMLQEPGQKQ